MRSKSIVLVALAIATVIYGASNQYFYRGNPFPPTVLPYLGIGIFLVFLWYRLDSDQLGYRRSPWLNFGVIALAVVALPYYFFRSRGAKRGAIATLLFLLAVIASSFLSALGVLAVRYGLQS